MHARQIIISWARLFLVLVDGFHAVWLLWCGLLVSHFVVRYVGKRTYKRELVAPVLMLSEFERPNAMVCYCWYNTIVAIVGLRNEVDLQVNFWVRRAIGGYA